MPIAFKRLTTVVALIAAAAIRSGAADRIVDIHVHFDEKNPHYIEDLLTLAERMNLTACVLTPYANRQVVARAARNHPTRIVPFGYVDLDASDALRQVEGFQALGYRGLGELEFVKKPYTDAAYMPIYARANRYGWVLMFHTGIVLRRRFDQPENIASYRMRAEYLEEIARRFPRTTVVGAHCGNPEYQWAAETARWNPNLFFDLSGSTLVKMKDHLSEFLRIFWWSGTGEGTRNPGNDPSAFSKLVFGSDSGLEIEPVVERYRALFKACDVPTTTQARILGGTLTEVLHIPSE